jgi:protein involved in polysaccharide export with SLBB domain
MKCLLIPRVVALAPVLVLLLLGGGCGTPPKPVFPVDPYSAAAAAGIGSADRIFIGDKLYVIFSDIPTPPPPHEDTVREDGMITLPQNQKIHAAGKTTSQLQDEIRALYVPGYYLRLTVTVKLEERNFTVLGEVRTPTRLVYTPGMTVLKAIASAGGFTEFARKTRVEIIRADGTKERVDCSRAQRDPRLDRAVYPRDQVIVPRRFW